MTEPSPQQLSATSRLFSPAVFREMAKAGRSAKFSRLVAMSGLDVESTCQTVGDVFDLAFSWLSRAGQRDEYVYRAALTQKVLLGTHSLNTASMLTEFRVGSSKADLVILNGTATVYEIKSERDTLSRLDGQLTNYRKVFASVNVITSESQFNSVLDNTPKDVGVMYLSDRFQISTARESIANPGMVCPVAICESVRIDEAIAILQRLGISFPDVPNTIRHGLLREAFCGLGPDEVHHAMVETLRETRSLIMLKSLLGVLPASLHAAALSVKVKKSSYQNVVDAASTPLVDAMKWN